MKNKKTFQKKIANIFVATIAVAVVGNNCSAMEEKVYSHTSVKTQSPFKDNINAPQVEWKNGFSSLFKALFDREKPKTPIKKEAKGLFDDFEYNDYINEKNSPRNKSNNIFNPISPSVELDNDENSLSSPSPSISPSSISISSIPTVRSIVSIPHISRDSNSDSRGYLSGEGADLMDDGEITRSFFHSYAYPSGEGVDFMDDGEITQAFYL
jgi:hypothetical protein